MARNVVRGLLSTGVLAANAGLTALTSRGRLPAFGATPEPGLYAHSPQFRDGSFRNAARTRWLPTRDAAPVTARELLFGGERRTPSGPVPLVGPTGQTPVDGLRITWFGHASSLIEIEGRRVLVDPVWSDRASPSQAVGPRRLHAPPHRLEELPELDVILVSHDHYDHLDMETVRTLSRLHRATFVMPLGVGAHLLRWGIPESRIVELDWGQHTELAGLRLTATPAQHFSGRGLVRNNTLWASWVIAGPARKVFYTGDSGYFGGFAEIGAEHGPFDATLIQVGAYNASWPDIHMTPEEGVATHRDVRGGLMIPVHWATFNLALHPWSEPADRARAEAKAQAVDLAVPKPGQRIDVDDPGEVEAWWEAVA